MTEPARHLALVDPESGEISPEAPSYPDALSLVAQLDQQVRMMERDLAGKRLRIATLEADREQAVLDSPWCRHVEVIHAVWKVACRKRRPLHFTDREAIEAVVRHKELGFGFALRVLAGACFDAHTKRLRNGRMEAFNDLDLLFRTFGKARSFAVRAPKGWEPDPEKVAVIAGVEVEWVREQLGQARREAA